MMASVEEYCTAVERACQEFQVGLLCLARTSRGGERQNIACASGDCTGTYV